MGRRPKYYRGLEVVSKKEEGKYYLDKPGQFEAEDVHLILYQKEKGRRNLIIYLLDLDVITSCSSKNYLAAVSNSQFQSILRKVSGVLAEEIYITKEGKKILEQYEIMENPEYC